MRNINMLENMEIVTDGIKEIITSYEGIYIPTGVNMINAPMMWEQGITGKGVTIAIIDTGCCTSHPDLKDNIIGGRNFTTEDNGKASVFEDYKGHGTHVAGIIAGNGKIKGVAPDAKLLILKALDKNGNGSITSICSAIQYAISKKVDIISMSLSYSSGSFLLKGLIDLAIASGISIVCTSGNTGDGKAETEEIRYPSGYNKTISVGAIDNNKSFAKFTSSNKEVDLVAPGVKIESTHLNNGYAYMSGTSMACPHVSGALALLKQWSTNEWKRELTEDELYAQLIKRTMDLKADKRIQGNGMLFL